MFLNLSLGPVPNFIMFSISDYFLPCPISTVTKGFVYSSFLKPYNPRCSHSDVSVGSHSSGESELSGSSSSHGISTPNSILTITSGNSPHKPPEDSGIQGNLINSVQTLSEVDAVCQLQMGPTVESAQPSHNPPSSRRHSNPDARNGHQARYKARPTPSVDNLRLKSSECVGNQVSGAEASVGTCPLLLMA